MAFCSLGGGSLPSGLGAEGSGGWKAHAMPPSFSSPPPPLPSSPSGFSPACSLAPWHLIGPRPDSAAGQAQLGSFLLRREGRAGVARRHQVLCYVGFFFFSSCPTACVVTEHVHMQSPLGHQTGNSLLTVTWAIRDGSEAPSSGSIVADPQHQGSRCGPG